LGEAKNPIVADECLLLQLSLIASLAWLGIRRLSLVLAFTVTSPPAGNPMS
jgi:hypothetical protein